MKYNKKKHLELLKIFPKSENSKKSLSMEDFLKSLETETRDDERFFELTSYSAMMISHLHWENREQYFELIEKLLNGPIKFLELIKKHQAIDDAGQRLQAEFILLEPNPKCEGFYDLVDELLSLFERYCPEPNLRKRNEFSEEELKKLIQNILIEMKNRYP